MAKACVPNAPNDNIGELFHYFDLFSRQNSLTGKKGRTIADDIVMAPEMHRSSFLLDSILAVGALQKTKVLLLGHPELSSYRCLGVSYYAKAVAGLRECLAQGPSPTQQVSVIWTTLCMGLFEV